MKTVYLLLGIPGSGKSTFAREILTKAKIIELDKVRQELSDKGVIGKVYSSADNIIVFKAFHEEILNSIIENDEIVVDATNARLSEREAIYNLLKDYKPKFVLVRFMDDKEVAIKRIIQRQTLNPNCVHIIANPEEAVNIYAKRIEESNVSLNEPLAEIWNVENCKIISKEQKILIATSNQGKINIYSQLCNELNLKTTNLNEIKVTDVIEENGKNELENAIIKAKAYSNITKLPVIANDSGLIIDKFKKEDQPGALVRRFKGKELTDKELLNLYIEKLNEVGGESKGHYNVALAAIDYDGRLKTREFKPEHYFINKPSKVLCKGVPLSSLSYDKKTNKYVSEMTPEEHNIMEGEEMKKQKDFIKEVFCK